jgi:hypothetical protein
MAMAASVENCYTLREIIVDSRQSAVGSQQLAVSGGRRWQSAGASWWRMLCHSWRHISDRGGHYAKALTACNEVSALVEQQTQARDTNCGQLTSGGIDSGNIAEGFYNKPTASCEISSARSDLQEVRRFHHPQGRQY